MSRIKFCTLLGDIPDKTLFAFDKGEGGGGVVKSYFLLEGKKVWLVRENIPPPP